MPRRPGGRSGPEPFVRLAARALLVAAIVLGAAACSPPAPAHKASHESIVVAAAVSLENSFSEIAQLYTARTGTKVDFSFGASGELEKQIEAGAPVDVFASAGAKEMDALERQGLIAPGSRADFASNSLVLVAPASSPLQIGSFAELKEAKVRRLAIGNPKTVPAGYYAQQALRSMHLWAKVEPRLVFAENVRQVLEYVAREEVSAGIVYATDVPVAHGKVRLAAQVPAGSYGPVLYPLAIVKGSSHLAAAERFASLVRSRDGRSILEKYGFGPVN